MQSFSIYDCIFFQQNAQQGESLTIGEKGTLYHLRYANDVVVAAADEADQRFPRILPQDAHPGELGGLLLEVGVRAGPFFVQLCQIRFQVEVVVD